MLATMMLVVGLFAVSEAGQSARDTALNGSNTTASTYNTTNSVLGGLVSGGGELVVWGGIAACVVGALGVLVYAGNQGGR